MAEALKTFREGEDILASETNENNQFLLSKLSDNAAQVQSYVEGEVATIKSNVASVQATLQNNIDEKLDRENKEEIVSWGMPDYSRATTWSTTGGIVPYDAKVCFYNSQGGANGKAGGTVKVNGILEYAVRSNEYEATTPSYVAYLPKGADVVATNMTYAYIIPLKGVTND